MNTFQDAMRSMGETLMRRAFESGIPVAAIESIKQTVWPDRKTVVLEMTLVDGFTFSCSFEGAARRRTVVPVIRKRFAPEGQPDG